MLSFSFLLKQTFFVLKVVSCGLASHGMMNHVGTVVFSPLFNCLVDSFGIFRSDARNCHLDDRFQSPCSDTPQIGRLQSSADVGKIWKKIVVNQVIYIQ